MVNALHMNRNEVIDYILESKLLTTCIDYQLKKQPQHYQYRDDIINDAWVWLLTYDEPKLIDAYTNNHLNALITRYLQNQLFSKTSEYYRRYIKLNSISDDLSNAKGIQG